MSDSLLQPPLKKKGGHLPDEARQAVLAAAIDCRSKGKTWDEISRELGVSRNTVFRHVQKVVGSIPRAQIGTWVERLRTKLRYDPTTGHLWYVSGRCTGKIADRTKPNWMHKRVRFEGRLYVSHRIGWLLHYGEWPAGQIDHINRDPKDNRIANLRLATMSQNQQNTGRRRNNTSGFKGVHFAKRAGKWMASIEVCGQKCRSKGFESAVEAAKAYDEMAIRFFADRATTNAKLGLLGGDNA